MAARQRRNRVIGACRLCSTAGVELRNSHIIPALIFRQIKRFHGVKTFKVGTLGPTGTHTVDVRRHIQDGPRLPILCYPCEQQLSKWEDRFAREILRPVHDRPLPAVVQLSYGPWLPKLAASLVWRSTIYHVERGVAFTDETLQRETLAATAIWREFIRDERESPGKYELHVWPLCVNEAVDAAVYYRDHVTEMAFMAEARHKEARAIVKLPRVVIEGVIQQAADAPRRETRVKMRDGFWSSAPPPLPRSIQALMRQRVLHAAKLFNQESQ